jgi:hypothetical protein
VSANSGGNFTTRLAHVTFDAPSLQATDVVGRRLGAQYTNAQLSGAAAGPIVLDRLFYNLAFSGGAPHERPAIVVDERPVRAPARGRRTGFRLASALSAREQRHSAVHLHRASRSTHRQRLAPRPIRLESVAGPRRQPAHVSSTQPVWRIVPRRHGRSGTWRRPHHEGRRRHGDVLVVSLRELPERPARWRACELDDE